MRAMIIGNGWDERPESLQIALQRIVDLGHRNIPAGVYRVVFDPEIEGYRVTQCIARTLADNPKNFHAL